MTPYWSDDWLTVYGGDARAVLRELEPESVHCVVTSPPYWGLRDYGTASWDGGELEHEHAGSELRTMPAGSAKQATNAGSLDVRSGDCDCGPAASTASSAWSRRPSSTSRRWSTCSASSGASSGRTVRSG